MLTRRDRAAMVHAYELLRDNASAGNRAWREGAATRVLADAETALRCSDLWAQVNAQRWRIVGDGRDDRAIYFLGTRLLRARLALYLRAVLRADAGDFGPCPDDCWGCRWSHVSDSFEHAPPRRITPLWELAPSTRAT